MAQIVIIDDDRLICKTLSRICIEMGHQALSAGTFADGIEILKNKPCDVVFLDVRLPDGDGLRKIPVIKSLPASPEVIIITGFADPDGAELAVKYDAWDYLEKPVTMDSISLALKRALEYRKEKQAVRATVHLNLKREEIIGKSRGILACLDLVARAADSHSNILITGETGTGKDLFARAIHANSPRAGRPFVVVDCAALPGTLIESILFGHAKGAFTGAERAEEGLIKGADGGTLFLDEVGELLLPMQGAFLRVLEGRRFRPVGETREVESDFRLVAASNRSLEALVDQGKFRSDLLFRLRSINIHLPALRDRAEDIRELAVHHLMSLGESYKTGLKGFSPEFFEALESHFWPGNVRELNNALEWAMAQARYEDTFFPRHLPSHVRAESNLPVPGREPEKKSPSVEIPPWRDFRKERLDEGEKWYLKELMGATGGNLQEALRISGLSQPRLYELLRKHNMPPR